MPMTQPRFRNSAADDNVAIPNHRLSSATVGSATSSNSSGRHICGRDCLALREHNHESLGNLSEMKPSTILLGRRSSVTKSDIE